MHSDLQLLLGREPPYRVGSVCEYYVSHVDAFRFRSDISGVLVHSGGEYCIVVNAGHPLVRRRFSAAHELYHYLCHRWGMDLLVCTDHPPPEMVEMELEANRFAAELLMPAYWLEYWLPGHGLKALARRFGVSAAAMGHRLEELRLTRRGFRG